MVNAGNQRLQIVWGYWLKQQSMHACTDMQCSGMHTKREGEGEYSALCAARGRKAGPDSEGLLMGTVVFTPGWKCSKIDYGNVCTTLNILRTMNCTL